MEKLLRSFIRESLREAVARDVVSIDSFDAGQSVYDVTVEVSVDEMQELDYTITSVLGVDADGNDEVVDPHDFQKVLTLEEEQRLTQIIRTKLDAMERERQE
jgi:hypothetical protein